MSGERLATIGDCVAGTGPGQFIAPHGIALDSQGDMYVADVALSTWSQCFPEQPMPPKLRTLHKLRHVVATAPSSADGSSVAFPS